MISVTPAGVSAKAGIQPGDIITGLAGQPVTSLAKLQSILAAHKPGDRIAAGLAHNGRQSTLTVTLGSLTG